MKMQKSCGQVNIPSVDNSAIECEEFVKDTCVLVKQGHINLLPGRDIQLSKVIEKIGDNFRDINHKFSRLGKGFKGEYSQQSKTVVMGSGDNLENFATKTSESIGRLKSDIDRLVSQIEYNKNSDAQIVNVGLDNLGVVSGTKTSRMYEALNKKLHKLDSQNEAIKKSFEKVAGNFSNVDLAIANVNAKIRDLDPRFSSLSAKILELADNLQKIDYRKVKINQPNVFLGLSKGDSLEGVVLAVENKLETLVKKDESLNSKISEVESNLKKTSNMVVDRQLVTVGTKINTPLSTVLGKIDEKLSRTLSIDTSQIPIVNSSISKTDNIVNLDVFLGEIYSIVLDLQTKQNVIKEQFLDLKNQVNTLRKER